MTACELDDCSRNHYRAGLCASHYMKRYRYGDPNHVLASRATDIAGRRFGSLVALRRDDGMWICQCDCGNQRAIRIGDLNRGSAVTCGERPTHPYKATVTYAGAHDRVTATKGRAAEHACIDCGSQAEHWSYDHADTAELTEAGLPYSTDPAHYDPRCIRCHRRFDRRSRAAIA